MAEVLINPFGEDDDDIVSAFKLTSLFHSA